MYLALDRADEAAPLLEDVAAYLEREYAAGMRHPTILSFLARTYVMQNRHDEALDMLAKAVDYDSTEHLIFDYETGFEDAEWNRFWQALRAEPRYIMQWNRMQALVDQRSANIRALLDQHDFDALLAPVMAMYEKTAAEAGS